MLAGGPEILLELLDERFAFGQRVAAFPHVPLDAGDRLAGAMAMEDVDVMVVARVLKNSDRDRFVAVHERVESIEFPSHAVGQAYGAGWAGGNERRHVRP